MNKKFVILVILIVVAAGVAASLYYFQKASRGDGDVNLSVKSKPSISVFEEPRKAVLIAVGDIMTSRVVAQKMLAHGYNYPFLGVGDYLKTGDIVFGNLETAITPGREIKTGETMFRSDPEVAQALRNAGFSILSLANNHTPNFGENGLKDTFKYLTEAGLKFVGAGNNDAEAYAPVFIEINGLKFAFLAYNSTDVVPADYGAGPFRAGTALMDVGKMTEAVTAVGKEADFVVVSMHAGSEYSDAPNEAQVNFAHAAIDAGADLVIGHHPHVTQPEEIYKGRHIFYSLGNFVFDQMWSQKTKEGLMVKIIFNKQGVSKIETKKILIEDYSRPRIVAN